MRVLAITSVLAVTVRGVMALPGTPVEMAPRAFWSGSEYCLWECPPSIHYNGKDSKSVTVQGYNMYDPFSCNYQMDDDPGGEYAFCHYDQYTGDQYLNEDGEGFEPCPMKALGPHCGPYRTPSSTQFKKRHTRGGRSRDQVEIRKRQVSAEVVRKRAGNAKAL